MQLEVKVSSEVLARINARIAKEHETKLWRPTAVAIVQCPQGEVLFAKSAQSHGRWGFPQGGIEQGETVIEGLMRELVEETALDTPVVTINRFCYFNRLHVPEHRDGFALGKSYYYFGVRCSAFPDVNLQTEELSAYTWLARPQADNLICSRGSSEEKSRSMLFALQKAFSA